MKEHEKLMIAIGIIAWCAICWWFGMPPYQVIALGAILIAIVGIFDLLETIKIKLDRLIEISEEKSKT